MRRMQLLVSAVALGAILLVPALCAAQVYVVEEYGGDIVRFDVPDDTLGTTVNPGRPFWGIRYMSLDALGKLVVCVQDTVFRFDPDTQALDILDVAASNFDVKDAYTDTESDDIYVIRNWELRSQQNLSHLEYLPDGVGPGQLAWEFDDSFYLGSVQVWPFGGRSGNILVLSEDPCFLAEIERGEGTSFVRLDDVIPPTEMSLIDFTITRDGDIIVLERNFGMFILDDGELVEFGNLPGEASYGGISAASDGTVYVTDVGNGSVLRFDESGSEIYPPLGAYSFFWPKAVVGPGFTPAVPGEGVPVIPIDGVELLFENVVDGGYTVAYLTESASHTSPRGNYLPEYADPPGGGRQEFTYVDLDSECVFRSLIQIDVFLPGSRMFFAHASGDTFRDVTIEGTIEDARGVISRFSEVVLVEDTRPLDTVVVYKFQRLIRRLTLPPSVAKGFCRRGVIRRLRPLVIRAWSRYQHGRYDDAIALLARFNNRVRAYSGWCIPDTSPNNVAGDVLAMSKTLQFSLGQLPGGRSGKGLDEGALSLAVTNPSRGTAWIELAGPADTEVSVRVYGVSGRLVSTLFDGRLAGGHERLSWSGTDGGGRRVASGVYFVRMEVGEEVLSRKLILMR